MMLRHMTIVTACSLVLFAINIMVTLIDILSIPFPRYIAGVSLSFVFAFAALAFLVPMALHRRLLLISLNEFAICGVLLFWGGIEGLIALTGGVGRGDLILSFLPILLTAILARLHLELFGAIALLLKAFILISAFLVATHTVLLILLCLDVVVPIVNMNEIHQKNGLALLLPVGLWLLTIIPSAPWPVFGRVYNGLLVLSSLHIWLNHSRGVFLITAWVVSIGWVSRIPNLNRRFLVGLLPLGVAVIVVALFAYPLLTYFDWLMPLIGEGDDDATSVLARILSNFLLVQKLAINPLLGLGWAEVAATRAYGYMSHTLYLIVASAYGLAGFLPVFIWTGFWMLQQKLVRKELIAHFFLLLILISSLFNDPFPLYGMVAVLVYHPFLQDENSKVYKCVSNPY